MGWTFNSSSISVIGMTFCWTWHVLPIYLEMSKYTSLNIELHESVVGTFFCLTGLSPSCCCFPIGCLFICTEDNPLQKEVQTIY